ncbi:MAG: YraN family protein [Elusimicrobia bacterium RIFOXYC2_FULL_34_12]|nr:MAG: YraN family protein [Elusimicrobia bacterium RIFOXYC2_FULL_34_12]OGS39029.1 MAG: YraN family protein [Elusimicrobia bacterium RIFOXYD2_FULL_34_30]HAM39692.1 YraN family protein [Elusimicrobiota bacterium]
MEQPNKIGKHGEKIAEEFLENTGYKIISKNYRTIFGEIDIIARKDNTIIFVEVKTRSGNKYGVPQLAVNKYKQKHLARAAIAFIKRNSLNSDYRFDIIAIINDKIEHIQNAFAVSGYTI